MTLAPNGLQNALIYSFVFIDAAARDASGGYTAADVGKLCILSDDFSLHMLTDDSPATWTAIGGGGGVLPTRTTITCNEFIPTSGGSTIGIAARGDAPFGLEVTCNDQVDGDTFELKFLLAPGSYDMIVCGIKAANRGIIDWAIDGTTVITGQDWYDPSDQPGFKFSDVVTVSGTGEHTLRLTLNGQNGASAANIFSLSAIWFLPD